MNNFEHPQFNSHNRDLRTIDGGRLIFPSKAAGINIQNLKLEGMNIPVSFTMLPEGRFRLNGMEEKFKKGLVMSGFLFDRDAKINHVMVDEELRRYAKEHGNIKIGESALSRLEESLKEKGIDTVYAVFYTSEIIEFFKRNGYDIIALDNLKESSKKNLGIDPEGFDKKIITNEDFEQLKSAKQKTNGHVLLEKHFTTV